MFWEKYIDLCEKNGVKPHPVAQSLGISSGAVTKWKSGAIPNDITIKKIANYFGVTVDELVNDTAPTAPAPHDRQFWIQMMAEPGNKKSTVLVQEPFEITTREKQLILAYRSRPEMHQAVDTLLGMEPESGSDANEA